MLKQRNVQKSNGSGSAESEQKQVPSGMEVKSENALSDIDRLIQEADEKIEKSSYSRSGCCGCC